MQPGREQIKEELSRRRRSAAGPRGAVVRSPADRQPDAGEVSARVEDDHHHFVCRACGATRDVDCAAAAAPCPAPASAGGFAVDRAEVTFWGICPQCQAAPATAPGEGSDAAAAR